MKKIKYLLSLSVLFAFFANDLSAQFSTLKEQVDYYQERYKVSCTDEKITNNFGKGFEALYGTRNMRPILHGVAYRGGSNNYYHETNKRDNHNPLPPDGMLNLCLEGFSDAVYLYTTNFSTADKKVEQDGKRLDYHQISGNSKTEIRQIIEMVYKVINREIKGPVYFHCWNGWHQSGYVSSAILKQFCNYSDNEAYDYWMRNTDGVNRGYDAVKAKVREFKPFDEFKVSKEISEEICPCRKK